MAASGWPPCMAPGARTTAACRSPTTWCSHCAADPWRRRTSAWSSRYAARVGALLERERLAGLAAEADRLAEGNAVRTALLAAVSHDLRSPLAGIKAAVSSLRQEDVDWSEEDEAALLETDRGVRGPTGRAGRQPARPEPPADGQRRTAERPRRASGPRRCVARRAGRPLARRRGRRRSRSAGDDRRGLRRAGRRQPGRERAALLLGPGGGRARLGGRDPRDPGRRSGSWGRRRGEGPHLRSLPAARGRPWGGRGRSRARGGTRTHRGGRRRAHRRGHARWGPHDGPRPAARPRSSRTAPEAAR